MLQDLRIQRRDRKTLFVHRAESHRGCRDAIGFNDGNTGIRIIRRDNFKA